MKPTKNSLVLYRQTPALVVETGDKIEIRQADGNTRSVREKDVVVLHPGPVPSFPDLDTGVPDGQPEVAWELLQGESPSLADLAELAFGVFTPVTAWHSFQLLNRTPWFRGTVDAIEVADEAAAASRQKAEAEKAAAEARWEDFIGRFRSGRVDREADEIFLRDLEMFALGRSKGSRILRTLGKTQTPENAHRVMLAMHACDAHWNPHPLRLDVPLDIPDYPLPALPAGDERLDLTGIEAFAIDDEGNEDPDDAVAWDGERMWVHVADAAALITAGSEADRSARERASSLYLPERIVPMLPPQAAERLGLGLQQTSPALSYAFTFDPQLNITGLSIHLTTVRVTRLTYDEAERRIGSEPLATLRRITDAFRLKREARGAVSIRMPEVKLRVSGDGEVRITPLPDLASRNLVTESMLMAGSQAALWCRERGIPFPFTVQEISGDGGEPEVGPAGGSAAPGTGGSPEGFTGSGDTSGLSAGPDEAADASGEVPAAIDGADYVDHFNRRRGMKRSRTTLECLPHAGLGLEAYSRVTSPLRRYPDLLASRQIRQFLLGREVEDEDSVLQGLAAFESRSGSLVQAERRSNLFWKLQWLNARPGWTGEAVMVDRRERQGFFLIPEIALETRVALKKDVKTGTRVMLKLKEVDIPESSVLFVVQEVLG